MDLKGFCEPLLWRKGGSLRGKQRKGEEGWCRPPLQPPPEHTHTVLVSTSTFMQPDKVMETRSWLLDMFNNRRIRPALWYQRSVFFTSNHCRLQAPCSLTHGYLMSTARLSGNLICWPTGVNKKASHGNSTLHVVLLSSELIRFALIKHSFQMFLYVYFWMWCSGFIKFLCDGGISRYSLKEYLNISFSHKHVFFIV